MFEFEKYLQVAELLKKVQFDTLIWGVKDVNPDQMAAPSITNQSLVGYLKDMSKKKKLQTIACRIGIKSTITK